MTWGKVDDNLAFHPKVIFAGNEAMGLWVRSLSWAMQQLTDGYVPQAIVVALNGTHTAKNLIEQGLWHEVDGGFQFNDWCDYQPTRQQVLGDRAKTAERQAKWRGKKEVSNTTSNVVSNGVSNGVTNSAPTRPDPTSLSKDRESASRIPSNFALTEEMTSWARSRNFTVNLEGETEKFVNYFGSLPGARAVKTNWYKTWQNWIIRSQEYRPATADVDPWAGKKHLGFDS